MLNYRIDKRLHTIGGPAVHQGMWPSSASNWWEAGGATGAVAVYQPKGAASYEASLVNLANPGTYDATTPQPPTWDVVSGWKRVAGQGYIDTGVVPTTSAWAFIFRFSDYVNKVYSYIGLSANPRYMAVGLTDSAGNHSLYNSLYNTNKVTVAGVNTNGVYCVSAKAYYNGSPEGTFTTPWTGGTKKLYILGCNGLATDLWPATVYFQAFAIYNNALDDAQVAAVSAAMAAL
jgi:hypothetical protein